MTKYGGASDGKKCRVDEEEGKEKKKISIAFLRATPSDHFRMWNNFILPIKCNDKRELLGETPHSFLHYVGLGPTGQLMYDL